MIRCCEACDVEWTGSEVPCWVCGGTGAPGPLSPLWHGPFQPRDPAVAAPL